MLKSFSKLLWKVFFLAKIQSRREQLKVCKLSLRFKFLSLTHKISSLFTDKVSSPHFIGTQPYVTENSFYDYTAFRKNNHGTIIRNMKQLNNNILQGITKLIIKK